MIPIRVIIMNITWKYERGPSDLLCSENPSVSVPRDFLAIDCIIIIFYVLHSTTGKSLGTEAQEFRALPHDEKVIVSNNCRE